MPGRRSVFISYSGSRDSVRSVADLIEAHGDAPWLDESLQAGQRWWDQILEKIRGCQVFVFVVSPRSAESVPCYFELHYAMQLRRPILPVFAEPIEPDQYVPDSLEQIQWVNIAEDDPGSRARLHEALDRIDPVPLPGRLPKPPVLPSFGRRRVSFKELEAAHRRLEVLVAIFSVVAWRSEQQAPPEIYHDGLMGGEVFRLECNEAAWGTASKDAQLFSCFVEEITLRFQDEEFPAARVTPSEDFYYRFEWESLFGTTLEVSISPTVDKALSALRDKLEEDVRAATEEGAEAFAIYVVGVEGLPELGPVHFLAAEGYYEWFQDGTVWPREGWVVYMRGNRRLALDEIERTVYKAAPTSNAAGDLEQTVHAIQQAWAERSADYLQRLVEMNSSLAEMLGEDMG